MICKKWHLDLANAVFFPVKSGSLVKIYPQKTHGFIATGSRRFFFGFFLISPTNGGCHERSLASPGTERRRGDYPPWKIHHFDGYVSFREGNSLHLKMDGWNTFSFRFGIRHIFGCVGFSFQGVYLNHEILVSLIGYLVGGWTNPSEKYARQNGNLPQIRVNIKIIGNHHPAGSSNRALMDSYHNSSLIIPVIPVMFIWLVKKGIFAMVFPTLLGRFHPRHIP